MIPKKIHYCWFGEDELPQNAINCISSWKKFCPEYEIISWDESNYDVNQIPYMKEAYEKKRYAFVSDYARLDIIYNEGGIYLDTDVELIKPLDNLLNLSCFMGMELVGKVNTGLGFGAEKGNALILENLTLYHYKNFFVNGKMDTTTCVYYTTKVLKKMGLVEKNEIQELNGITILPPEYLCPINIEAGKLVITENTFSIHHYNASWYTGSETGKKYKKKILPFKIKLRRIIDRTLGEGVYDKIKNRVKRSH